MIWRLIAVRPSLVGASCWSSSASGRSRRSGPIGPVAYDDIAEHFKYGSIGSEPGGSLLAPVGGVLPPYRVFKALPSICSDKLPGGYASVGFDRRAGPRPADRRVAAPAARHRSGRASTARCATPAPSAIRRPRRRASCSACRRSSSISKRSCSSCSTARSTTGRRADAVQRPVRGDGRRASLFERVLLRVGLIDRLKLQTLELRNRIAPILAGSVPQLGPRPRRHVQSLQGDPVQLASRQAAAVRADRRVGLSVALEPDAARGHAPALGRRQHVGRRAQPERRARRGRHAGHGRSRGDQARARLDLDAAAAGLSVSDRPGAGRARRDALPAALPRVPRRPPVPRRREGRARASARSRTSTRSAPIGIASIRTPTTFAANQYALYPESQYRFTHFRKTNGYANQPLDGIWLRGPYLHNGSVPTLRDLLEPPERRPAVFYRGYDVFDQAKVGFVSNVPQADGRTFFRYDTSRARATATAATSTARRCRTRTSRRLSST